MDGQGAVGFTGLILHVFTPNAPTASLTLPGYSSSDLGNARLTVQLGNEADGTLHTHHRHRLIDLPAGPAAATLRLRFNCCRAGMESFPKPGPSGAAVDAFDARRTRLLAGIDLAHERGFEVGPLASPLVRKSESDIRYVDYADETFLKAKYADDPKVDVSRIVAIDAVWGDRPLKQCFAGEAPFDYAVASHVLEHVPDLVGWLNEVAEVLRPGGRLCLAVPDRRFTFDYLRRTSSLSEIIDAYLRGSRRASPGQVFDCAAHYAEVDPDNAWGGALDRNVLAAGRNLGGAFELARASTRDAYIDTHCWVFTASALLNTMAALTELGLLAFRCFSFHEPQPCEIEALLVLQKIDPDDPLVRDEAHVSFLAPLRRIDKESGDDGEPARQMRLWQNSAAVLPTAREALFTTWRSLARAVRWRGAHARRRAPRPRGASRTNGRAFLAPFRRAALTESLPPQSELGRSFPEYRRLFVGPARFVDVHHEALARMPAERGLLETQTPGFLRRPDALALYELGYFCAGDLLEIGSAWGLSTTILCMAVIQAARDVRVVSIERDPQMRLATAQALASLELTRLYYGLQGEADVLIRQLVAQCHRFSLVFIDHDHSLEATRSVCHRLGELLLPGGVAVFHDFNDARNTAEPSVYGIYAAVAELLDDQRFSFLGVVGCCGIVQRLE